MNALDQLNGYLQRLEKRLRFLAVSKGTSLVAVSALAITVLLVWIINGYAFSSASLLWARILLFLSIAVAIAFGLVIPLLHLNRRNAAQKAEQKFPDFQERLLTLAEKSGAEKPNAGDPFLQLLAADTMRVAESSEPERVAASGPIIGFLASAAIAVAVLIWLITAGPGYMGYGTSLLWAGAPKAGERAFYDIAVTPGDRTVRRKADQLVTAQLLGFDSPKIRLFAQYGGTSKWEQVDMQPTPGANTYEFLFSSLPDNVEYYVQAGAVESKHYKLRVVDLPAIKKIRVTYHYPAWTGMKDGVEDPGGDLRAVQGTEAEVAILTDRPLAKGILMIGDNRQIELKNGDGNWSTAKVTLDQDGLYHVAAIDRGENVRLSEDFFIEAKKVTAPTVKIDRPGRDAHVNPIEEVTITVDAQDDFGLNDVGLHYSVNGGPEKAVELLQQKGAKSMDGKYVLALEDYKMKPGDLVSIYAEARNPRNTTKTDIYFIQADPFERNYSQSQSGGGGGMGGGADADQQISQRQKDIIAATWNEQKNGAKDATVAADDARFLAEQEEKLAAQAKSLADRMKARELAEANPQFQSFAKDMTEASQNMMESAKSIRNRKWSDAMPSEQKALQGAQRAEATFRDIQVAFGTQGGGGGGAGAGRDLANLADLELDREKNQYETGQQASSDSHSQDIDKALQKLAELARRQQELANNKDQQQPFRQRWEQEMLRREAEQLQKQMEQLQQQQQQGSQQGQQSQSGQQGQQGQQGQSGSQSAQSGGQPGSAGRVGSIASPQLQRALDQLKKATEDMQNAENQQKGGQEQTAAGQRRAADRLNEARDILNGMQHQNASQQLDDLAQKANQLAQQETDAQTRLRKMLGSGPVENPRFGGQGFQNQKDADQLASEKSQMADQLKKLEQGMQDTARSMAGAQNPVSNKLRDALGQAQQNELEMHMRQDGQFIRQGYGASAWVRENNVQLGLNNLRDALQQAQAANQQQAGKPGQGPGGDNQDLENALARLEAMRSRMQQAQERAQGNGQGQGRQSNPLRRGNQSEQGQPGNGAQGQQGQPGQQSGQQPGQQGQNGQQGGQSGQGNQQAQNGQPGQNGSGGQRSPNNGYAPYGGGGPANPGYGNTDGPVPMDQAYRESLRDLNQLRDFIRDNPDIQSDYSNLSHALNPGFVTNDAELANRLSHEVLPELERLELDVRRKLEDKNSDQVRSAGSETVPPGYSDAVADYFRKLSQTNK